MSGSWRSRVLGVTLPALAVAFLAGLAGLAGAVSADAATGSPASVYVVNGILGSAADVLIDGAVVAPSAAAKAIVGPLQVAPGNHVVALRSSAGSTVATARFTAAAGTSLDLVAHRQADAAMAPLITVFTNDQSSVRPGKSRLVVSNVAVAPPADIRVDGKPLFRAVANGESLSLVVPAKTYSVDIVPTATSGPTILAPIQLEVRAGTLTRVFAVGDASAGTADAVVQVLSVPVRGARTPSTVQTGDGGQAADSFVTSSPLPTMAALVVGLGGVGLLGALRAASRGERLLRSRHSR